MPDDWTTTISLTVATLLAGAATGLAWRRWRSRVAGSGAVVPACTGLVTLLAAALLAYRALTMHETWRPLTTHVDGLLLLVGLLGLAIAYLQSVGRLRGLDVFGLPIVTVALAWAVCASWWTFDTSRFDIAGVWEGLHVVCVYVGVAAGGLAAATGAMYLVARRQLRRRDDPARGIRLLGRLASLETIESHLMRWATVGFVVLTIALGLGIVQATTGAGGTADTGGMAGRWWASGKVWGAALAWGALGLVMHARTAPRLRGRAAACISIVGFVLLLVVLATALSVGGCAHYDDRPLDASAAFAIEREGLD
ncbi:MAG: hypothetical protein GVY28_08565 [Alphaproteobacteria bacterium]|jgi:ABC-type uncharacterized transport system permease subunit|nr:hypothetical protein [Alphaproteobacteria bacterium]